MTRTRAMRTIAGIMAVSAFGFGLFTIVFGIVSPAQEPHAFHNALVAALLIVVSAPPAVAIARDPNDDAALVMLAAVGVAALATMALGLTLDPFTLPFVVLVGVLWALRSNRGAPLKRGRVSPIVLALCALVAIGLAPYVLHQAGLQRTDDTSEHDAFFHWVEMSFYAMAIPLLGLLAGLRPAAYRLAGWISAIALAVLGIASLLLGAYASSLPALPAWAALAGGPALLGLVELERRRDDRAAADT